MIACAYVGKSGATISTSKCSFGAVRRLIGAQAEENQPPKNAFQDVAVSGRIPANRAVTNLGGIASIAVCNA
jgi:hypothetical protein